MRSRCDVAASRSSRTRRRLRGPADGACRHRPPVSRFLFPSRGRDSRGMPHRVTGHDVPVEVKDILKWRTGVRRETKALCTCIGCDPRRGQDEPAGKLGVGEISDRPNVPARDNEHMQRRRGGFGVEREQVGVFVADVRWGCVRCDPAKHAVDTFAQRNFTRPSRSGGLSASPSSTRITNFFSQCGVG